MLDVGCSRRWRAFTLLELLTAISILGIIVAILFQAFQSTSNMATRNENKTEVNQVVRAVVDIISRDLNRSAYSATWVNMFQEDSGGTLSPGLPIPTNTIYWITDVEPDCNNDGYVNIGYRIAQDTVGGVTKWVLQRGDDSLVDPTTHPADWWFPANIPPTANVNNLPTTDPTYLQCYNTNYWKTLSENVIGIQFQYFTNTYDHTQNSTVWPLAQSNQLPYTVGVSIWTIDTDSYNKALHIDPALTGAGTNLIVNNMRYYYTRIFIPRSTQNP